MADRYSGMDAESCVHCGILLATKREVLGNKWHI
jgi:hypothetical protein